MRNLKRVLSLALASVMLLGMMVVGSSAAFSDADEVVYKEAVEITAGLGLFAGADGKFDPQGTLTRAQMATIIVKMLYGSDYNADSWKGLGKFPDTADYQGGWAEGYIALCASLGIVGGYPNGKFEPGNPVNAAEAATMIINALDIDAGEGEWPGTVMAKADDLKLFDGLNTKPGAYKALTREELAATVLVGINTSPSGKGGWTIAGTELTFETQNDAVLAVLASGGKYDLTDVKPAPAGDTLATKVFGMKTEAGYIVANQGTGAKYTELSTGLKLDLETGADMIGHYVTAYYAEEYVTEDETGKAYAIVDEAKYITVASKISKEADIDKAFGSKTDAAKDAYVINGDVKVAKDADFSKYFTQTLAVVGTYVVVDNEVKGYIAPLTVYAGEVDKVEAKKITIDGDEYANEVGKDFIVEYEGIAAKDVILYNKIGDVVVVEEAGYIEGKITKITGTKIFVDGEPYEFTAINVDESDLLTSGFDFKTTYKVYLDNAGKWFGLQAPGAGGSSTEAELKDIYYVYEVYAITEDGGKDSFGNDASDTTTYYANVVDMAGKNSQIVIGINAKGVKTLAKGFYTFADSSDAGIKKATAVADKANDKKTNLYYSSIADTKLEKTTVYVENAGAFLTDETVFILIKDEKPGDASALKTAITTGAIDKTRTTAAELVLGFDAKKNVVIKAVIIETSDLEAEKPADNVVYITAAQVKDYAQVGDKKYEFNVYFIADGQIRTITTAAAPTAEQTGFYTVSVDTTKGVYTLKAAYADASIESGVKFVNTFGDNLMITDNHAAGIDVSKAYVVDVRAEKGGYDGAIDSIEDIEAAAAKAKEVTLDLYTKSGKVVGIYVISTPKKA